MFHEKVRVDTNALIPMLAYAFLQGFIPVFVIGSITTNLRKSEFVHNIIPIDGFSLRSGRE